MEIAIFCLLMVNIAISLWSIRQIAELSRRVWLKYASMQEEMNKLSKHLVTAGKVLQVYEDETKILERRKNQEQVKQRFARNPR